MDVIGTRLKSERTRLGFNQTDFGAIGGVQKLAQHKYEKGERYPGADYLAAVAKAGADVQYIITGTVGDFAVPMTSPTGVESISEQAIRATDELSKFLRNQMPLRAVDLPTLRGLLECVNRMSYRVIEEVEGEHQARRERYRPS
ncbi:TPA: helix-turn-helix domain-containing protein [Pseudomonas aeruginosa]